VQSYLALALPAVIAGLSIPRFGLDITAYIYGAVIIVLAVVSMLAALWSGR
jgi:hypothetical protein